MVVETQRVPSDKEVLIQLTDLEIGFAQAMINGEVEYPPRVEETTMIKFGEESQMDTAIKLIKYTVGYGLVTTDNFREPKRPLTLKQSIILARTYQGFTLKQIAEELDVTPHAIASHRQEIYVKIHVKNTLQAVAWVANERKSQGLL